MEKLLLAIITILSTAFAGKGQNLVPNGDFEQYSGCPTGFGKIDSALFWMNPSGASPDYFNQCATFIISVPDNYYGYQNPHSGVAYCGIVGYRDPTMPIWREYVEVALTSSLIAGQCYQLEMYISLANYSGYTSDAIGAYFSNSAILGAPGTLSLPYSPQIDINLGLITDTINWILITGNFIASGGENYMTIGNFKDDAQTNALPLGGSLFYSYFYIDDVSLSPCTAIEEQNQNDEIKIYPNPVNDKLNIAINNNELSEIILYDVACRKLMQQEFTSSVSLNTEQLAKGIYLYEVRKKDGVIKKGKVVKE